ncbi:MAG: PEP-utilizing enzyme, partial [Verrucomicrobiota bacterium]
LEEQLLKKWDAPLINDFLAMIAFGVLRKLCAKWADDADPNALVAGAGDEIISLEPARRIQAMAQLAAERKSYRSEWEQYLEKFGDRCLEELKLESPTLHDDDTPLLAAVEGMAAVIKERGRNQNEGAASSTQSTPAVAVKGWLRRRVFAWVLRQTRNRVRDRENLRFERTRLFGQVRRIMVEKGRHWHEEGRISQPDDVFYLTIEEILHDDISPKRIESRRLETERFLQNEPPPDRIESISDDPTWTEKPARSLDSATEKSGTACCPGRVRGQVRVVIDPRDADIRPGEILVARQTDPGWVMLFPAASGLLVERGSMLSHSAIVSREMGLPSIVGLSGVCDWLETGDEVEMDGSEGWVKLVKRSSSEATGSTPES